jgi:hypothetical protein
MLKSGDALLAPDGRFASMAGGRDATGAVRPMAISDLYDLVEPLELGPGAPPDIVDQFDKARHAFIYSWFAYDLVSLAEQQGYQTLEMALRDKLPPDERKNAHRLGLGALLEHAVAHRWLVRSDFEGPDRVCVLDYIPRFRNELAHGSRSLFPGGSIEMLRVCHEILDKLFQ